MQTLPEQRASRPWFKGAIPQTDANAACSIRLREIYLYSNAL